MPGHAMDHMPDRRAPVPVLGVGRRHRICRPAAGLRRSGSAGSGAGMRMLLWHVHGSWTTAFVQGPHDYVVPVLPDRGADGIGRARTWDWPASVRELAPEQLAD